MAAANGLLQIKKALLTYPIPILTELSKRQRMVDFDQLNRAPTTNDRGHGRGSLGILHHHP